MDNSIDEFKKQVVEYFNKNPLPKEEPIYKIGDIVKVKSDLQYSYISTVIGSGKIGKVISICCIPLIEFNNGSQYYIYQNKLKLCI